MTRARRRFTLDGEDQSMCTHDEQSQETPRRTFIGRLTLALGGVLTAAISAGPIGMLLHPVLKRQSGSEADAWSAVASAASFPVGGAPKRVVLKEDRQDAWLRQPGVPVGSILVQRESDEAFKVFSAVCPHLGCAVGYQAANKRFLCPCHTSSFTLAGELLPHADGSPNPAPRGLDPLEWRVQAGQLQVRWVNYKTGTPERVRVS